MRAGGSGCALVLMVIAAFTGSCGSDGEAPSRDTYVADVNAVCAELGKKTERLADDHFANLEGEPSADQVAAYTRAAVELQRAGLEEARSLTPPAGDEDEVAAIYDSWEKVIDELEASPEGELNAAAAAAAETFRKRATGYGLTECGEG